MLRAGGFLVLSFVIGCTDATGPITAPCPELPGGFVQTEVTEIPDPGPLPARREYFRDPTFGTCIARLTDGLADIDPPAEYSVLLPSPERIRGDGLEVLVGFYYGELHRYDVANLAYGSAVPITAGAMYDLNDPTSLYYVDGFQLRAVSPTMADHVVFDFQTRVVADFADGTHVSPGQIPTSADQSRWAFKVLGPGSPGATWTEGIVVWDPASGVIGSRPARCFADVGVSPSGRHVVVHNENDADCNLGGSGPELQIHAPDLADPGTPLLSCCNGLVWTLAALPNGHDALVWVEDRELVVHDIDESPPLIVANIPVEAPLGERGFAGVSVSAAPDRPGWVVVTQEDRITIVELTGAHRSFDVAFHHSATHAVPSRDLRHIFFTSNWVRDRSSFEERLRPSSMFVIALPGDALP